MRVPDRAPSACLYEIGHDRIVRQALCTGGDQADQADVSGISAFELVPKAEWPNLRETLRQAFDTGQSDRIRYAIPLPERGERVFEARISPARPAVRPDSVHLAIIDVTELVAESHQARRDDAEFEILPDTVFRIAPDGTILDCRCQSPDDLYVPPEQFLGRRLHEIVPAHVSRLWDLNLPRLFRGEQDVSYEYELDLPRSPQHFEARLSVLPDCEDIIVVSRNITDRHVAEQRLRETNRKLEEAQAVAHVGSWDWDIDADRAVWTPELYRIFDVDPDKFQPSKPTVMELVHPDDHDRFLQHIERWVDGVDAGPLDFRVRRPDGTLGFFSARAKVERDRICGAIHLIGTVQDVTERTRTEQALIASEERFRRTVELSWDMILLLDTDARVRYVNDSIERILGLRVNQFLGMIALDIVHPDDLRRARQALSELHANPGLTRIVEVRVRHRDGSWRWIEAAAKNLLDAPGLGFIVANIRDTTDRWIAEQKLQTQERRFRALIENSTDAIALVTLQGTLTYTSPAHAHVLGYDAETMLGANLLKFIAPESRDAVRALFAATERSPDKPLILEAKGLKQDGTHNYLEGYLTNLLDVPGVEAIVCNYRDVTERVRQQEALEKAHREADLFRRMVDLSSQAIGTADLEARVLYQNPALLRLLGLPSLKAARGYTYEDFYHPEDLEYLRTEVIATVLSEGQWTGELELQPLLGGSAVPTIQSVYLVRDDDGQPIAFSNVITDISEQKRIEHILRASEAKYRSLFEEAPFGIAVADPETGILLDINPALCSLVGRRRKELVGRSQRFLHPPDEHIGDISVSFDLHRTGQADEITDERLITATGEIRHAEIKVSRVDWEGRAALQGVFHDLTDRKRAEEALYEEKERAQVTLHSIGDAVITTDETGRVDYLNPVAEALTGWRGGDARGRDLGDVFATRDEETGERLVDPIVRCLREGTIVDKSGGRRVLVSRDGREYAIDESAAPIRRPDGTLLGAVLVFHDVSEARQLTRKMAYDATHDPLTGLLNRREFEYRLDKALESAHKYGSQHGLCYIDLDQFKIVNDTAGHAAGDELLKHIPAMLEGIFRDRDTLARLGGDEFGLLLDNCPIERAATIAGRIVEAIRAYRFVWDGRSYQVGASTGVTAITSGTGTVTELLNQADVACYTAKELGRNRVHVYHEQDGAPLRRHSGILQAAGLRDALERERFRLFCQPIVPLNDSESESDRYELLLRLLDADGNLVLPGAFMPTAERCGLMGELDRWVIRTACQSYATAFDHRPGRISVNLSGNSLNDETLLGYVREQFAAFALVPERICIEITETAAVHDIARAARFLSELKDLGCQLALDDFGSGLSSLRYLKALPVDYLKIDGSFVKGLEEDSGDRAIVTAVNQLAHALGIRTIAKHASSEGIVDTLRALGVDFAQGYAFGHPLPCPEAQVRMPSPG